MNIGSSKCFIVAAGPSIVFTEMSKIHHDNKNTIFSINSSIILMPWLDNAQENMGRRFWFSSDILCIKWDYYKSHVLQSACTRIVRDNWKNHKDVPQDKFEFFKAKEKGSEDGLLAQSSTTAAVHYALLNGFKKIVLLGCDQKFLHQTSHFWGFIPNKLDRPYRLDKGKNFFPCQRQQERVFRNNIPVFEQLNKLAKELGAEIYNCSHISTIKVFPKISLDEAIKL